MNPREADILLISLGCEPTVKATVKPLKGERLLRLKAHVSREDEKNQISQEGGTQILTRKGIAHTMGARRVNPLMSGYPLTPHKKSDTSGIQHGA